MSNSDVTTECPTCWLHFDTPKEVMIHRYSTHEAIPCMVHLQGFRRPCLVYRDRQNLRLWCPIKGCLFSCFKHDELKVHCKGHRSMGTFADLWDSAKLRDTTNGKFWIMVGAPLTTPQLPDCFNLPATPLKQMANTRVQVTSGCCNSTVAKADSKTAEGSAPGRTDTQDLGMNETWLAQLKLSTMKTIVDAVKEAMESNDKADESAFSARIAQIVRLHNMAVENLKKVG